MYSSTGSMNTGVRNTFASAILDEGNFLTEGQAWIARKQHYAGCYVIKYGTDGDQNVLRRMANENSSGSRYYPDQKQGLYRAATPSNIEAVFSEIAAKINIALTK
jgi:hypothetical protein